jgi:hypothetical protein
MSFSSEEENEPLGKAPYNETTDFLSLAIQYFRGTSRAATPPKDSDKPSLLLGCKDTSSGFSIVRGGPQVI